jgi:hypothetical protein
VSASSATLPDYLITCNVGEQRSGCFRRAWISDHAQPKATRYEDCDLFAL